MKFKKNIWRILRDSSFIKGWIFCFEFWLQKTNVNYTYLAWKSLSYDETPQLFGDCQLKNFLLSGYSLYEY